VVPIASHDDDCEEAVVIGRSRGATISEFPIALEVARAAVRQGQHVVVGAPNVVLGQSNTGNMRARDAILAAAAHILCSDYHAPSMLPAVFSLAEELGMPAAVALVSAAPAAAVGLEAELGSIEPGKRADLVLARSDAAGCSVESHSWRAGRSTRGRSVPTVAMRRRPRRHRRSAGVMLRECEAYPPSAAYAGKRLGDSRPSAGAVILRSRIGS
jgi:alpha-D-ribose 1-methylphosphonate 5-triphosphate diphosphatase